MVLERPEEPLLDEPSRGTPPTETPPTGTPTLTQLPTSAQPLVKIGRYRLLETIGEGGMSVVYRAEDELLKREVALKVLHRHLARDPEARARFIREARAVARLQDRHILDIYDFSSEESTPDEPGYLAMEYVDGGSLSDLLHTKAPLYPEVAVAIALGVAQALKAAHAQEIIHRDVKPENILIGRDGVVKLADFGIAQVLGHESMTMTGTLIGSPAHMAPEQIDAAQSVDSQTDLWALGTVLYTVATGGTLPFQGTNPHQLLRQIIDGHYEDPRRLSPHIDSPLAHIIRTCLSVSRASRYADAQSLIDALQAWYAKRQLPPPEHLIRDTLADPQGSSALLSQHLIARFMQLGEETTDDRSLALEYYGRVLSLDPNHDEAFTALHRLQRQLQRRTGLRRIGILLGALLPLLALTLYLTQRPPTPAPAPPPPLKAHALPPIPLPPTRLPVTPPRPATTGTALGQAIAALPPIPEDRRTPRPLGTRPAVSRPEIPVRITVFPPAARILLNDTPIQANTPIPLRPGRHRITLKHTGCPDCPPEEHLLQVPRTLPEGQSSLRRHYDMARQAKQFAPATFKAICDDGSYVLDRQGRRFECGRVYEIPVHSAQATLITLTAYTKNGERLRSTHFRLLPNQPMVWPL